MNYLTYQDILSAYHQHWSDYVTENLGKAWNWHYLSGNSNVNEQMITNNPSLPWKRRQFIFNNTLSWNYFNQWFKTVLAQHGPDHAFWTDTYLWEYLSEHPNLHIDNVLEYPHLPWEKTSLVTGPNMTYQMFTDTFITSDWCSLTEKMWAYSWASGVDFISISYILSHPYYHWDWNEVIIRSDVTLPVLTKILSDIFRVGLTDQLEHQDIEMLPKLEWSQVSRNPNITYQYIIDNPSFNWSWRELSRNPGISLETILQHPHQSWDWKYVSENPNLSWNHVLDNPTCPWSRRSVSRHHNIPAEVILENPSYPWVWEWVCLNPNIGWKHVLENPERAWNYEVLSRNTMTNYKTNWIATSRTRWIAARRIHRFWRDVTSNPTYKLAKRLLLLQVPCI